MANPTLQSFEVMGGAVITSPLVSASKSWNTGDVFTVAGFTEGLNNGITLSISNTGSGLSWSNPVAHTSSSDCSTYLWTAQATANSSGTISVTFNGIDRTVAGVAQYRAPSGASIAVGHTASGLDLTNATNGGSNTVALTASSADSSVFWGFADWGANATANFNSGTPTPTTHAAGSPGPTAEPNIGNDPTHYTWGFDTLDDQTSTGSTNYGWGNAAAQTSPKINIVVAEVTISGGAAAPIRRMPLSL